MKLLESNGRRIVFGLGMREKSFLERLLSFYPLRPDGPPVLSRGSEPGLAEATELLAETLEQERESLSAWIRSRLQEGPGLTRQEGVWRLCLEGGDADRLLRVLNELRVGAWVRLGSPEQIDDPDLASGPGQAPLVAIMMLSGQFEVALLQAMEAGSGGSS